MNWLEKARNAASKTEAECACSLRMAVECYRELEAHPGRLTLNEVGALSRLFGEDVARSMMANVAEVYA